MTDRYQIINLLGTDPLGSVYLAYDVTLQRRVVYREFNPKEGEANSEGFSRYSGKLCALQHPNILTIFDVSTAGDDCFLVTEFIEGESLEDRLAQGALNQVGVHNMACDLLDALHTAHTSGLYHGALRSDSIKRLPRVRGGHRYLIVDFGLDRIASLICGKSVFMADPVLMAPELHGRRENLSEASDLFTLGQLCYTALVGGHPYAGKTAEECQRAYLDGGLPHLNTYVQGVYPEFADWVMWLVSGHVEARPASSEEAMKALHAIKLDVAEPNVAGVTSAQNVPYGHARPLVSPSKPVGVISNPPALGSVRRIHPKTQPTKGGTRNNGAEGRSFLFWSITVVAVLLVVLVAVLVMRGKDEPEVLSKGAKVKKVDSWVRLEKVKLIPWSLGQRKPENIPLDAGEAIDWTVVTGVPASSARVMMKGGDYIRNILAIGGFTEFIDSRPMMTYSVADVVISPQRGMTDAIVGQAKPGQGWEVTVRIPETHRGDLRVTLFLIQDRCSFDIEVISATSKKTERLHVAEAYPGVVRIPLYFSHPKAGYYSIRVLAGADIPEDTGFEMGLSAVLLESVK